MKNINSIIDNFNDLQKHYTIRDGFVFTSITEPANIFDAIVLRYPETCDCHTPKVGFSDCTLQECIFIVKKYNIKKALIIAESIEFLKDCPSLECLEIVPADTAGNSFDYSPLYEMSSIIELNCKTEYGKFEQFSTIIDYARIKGLKKVSICKTGHMNYSEIPTLESLSLSNLPNMTDLHDIKKLCALQSLNIIQCGILTLNGVEALNMLKQLNIGYCRKLKDISTLSYVGRTLKQLSIENCNKIDDFNFLFQMTGLLRLCLDGKNNLPNLYFLKSMLGLKELILWMNVLNGDITPCVGISYVSLANRKHYNMKDSDLSKVR